MQRNGLHCSAANWTKTYLSLMLAQVLGWRPHPCSINPGLAHTALLNPSLLYETLTYEVSPHGAERSISQNNPHTWGASVPLHHRLPRHPRACYPTSVSHNLLKQLCSVLGKEAAFPLLTSIFRHKSLKIP